MGPVPVVLDNFTSSLGRIWPKFPTKTYALEKMYFKFLPFCAVFLLIAYLARTSADPVQEHVHLWKITHPKNQMKPSYLLGTLHVPWEMLYNKFPKNIKNAILGSDFVVIEMNIPLNVPNCIIERGPSTLFNNGELKQRFEEDFPEYLLKLPSDWLHIELNTIRIERQLKANSSKLSLDRTVEIIGESNGKEMRYLDEEEDLCTFLPNVNEDQILLIIKHTLDLAEAEKKEGGNNLLKDIVEWYKRGELTEEKYINSFYYGPNYSRGKQNSLDEAYKHHYSDLVHIRNKKWIEKMHKWMVEESSNGRKSFFFAVGLMHIISIEDNLPQLLREKGYTVEAVPQNTIMPVLQPSRDGNEELRTINRTMISTQM
ncbi:hypothetical protein niasHT_013030 [Heterodera trifolii]|uniref:Metalloprotease TIKI homolog n=1 Tax=Heterodera trifolii TaxID=157864 RepID=A0ABD2L3T2_9BILA